MKKLAGLVLFWSACALAEAPKEPDFARGMLDRKAALAAAREVTPDKYPDADAVVVDRATWVRYRADGTEVQWQDHYDKVLTEKGRRQCRTLASYFTIPYQRGPEDCKISLVEVVKPDGRAVPVDLAKNSRVMVDSRSMGANIYNPNHKVIRVSIPHLEVGDVLHYVMFDRVVHPRCRGTFATQIGFESTWPIVRCSAEIRGPADCPLRSLAVKDRVGRTLTRHEPVREGGEIVYRWEARDVPRMFPEPSMPPAYMVVQRARASTAASWEHISRWYWKLSEPHYKHTSEMRAKVDELVQGVAQPRKRTERIFYWVAQNIRYMGITAETKSPGYEPHDVKDTFERRHGVCRDKAALLVVMLRLAGVEAFPVLIHTSQKRDAEVPDPFFNHAVTAVRTAPGEYRLMDPTSETTRQLLPAYLNNRSYLVICPEGEKLRTSPIDPPEKNMLRVETTGRIDATGVLRAESVCHFGGFNDTMLRGYLARQRPEERRRFFQHFLEASIRGVRVTSLEILPKNLLDRGKPLTARMGFEAREVPVHGERRAMLPLPLVSRGMGMRGFVERRAALEKRKYPLLIWATGGAQETLRLELAGELGKALATPAYEPVDDETMSWRCSARCEKGVLTTESDFRLKVVEFSPEQYLGLKEHLRTMERDGRKMLILDAAQAPPVKTFVFTPPPPEPPRPDVAYLDRRIDVELDDARNWTETHAVRKRILSYAGKKAHAEVKLTYNPVWEDVELLGASVRGRDGTVQEISDKEINVMDVTSNAPRYPMRKTLVASLPGVEVGSVVEFRCRRTFRDQPFFATRVGFRDVEATRKRTVRISAPKGLALRRELVNNAAPGGKAAVAVKETKEGDRVVVEWTAENVAPLRREQWTPPGWSFAPAAFVSAGSWPGYAKRVHAALAKAAAGQEQAAATARRLVAGKDAPSDRVRAVRDFVAMRIRLAGPALPHMPLKHVTPADRTLADGYGNGADRAVLLHAMLRAIGLEPRFVLASTTSRVPEVRRAPLAYPDPHLFPDVLVTLRLDGEAVWLNDTDQYAALGATHHDGRAALALPDGTVETIQPAKGKAARSEAAYDVAVQADGTAVIRWTRKLYGTMFGAMNRRFAEMTPELRRRYHQEQVSAVSQAAEALGDLKTDFSTYPGVETFAVRVRDYAVRDGEHLYFRLPRRATVLPSLPPEGRDTPLYLGSPLRSTQTIRVTLPKGFRAVLHPGKLRWRDRGSTVVRSAAREADGTLVVTQRAAMRPSLVPSKDYYKYVELCRKLTHPGGRLVLLEKD